MSVSVDNSTIGEFLKILIITNSETHSKYDSIFDIAKEMHRPEKNKSVFIGNVPFTSDTFRCKSSMISYREYTKDFIFDNLGKYFDPEYLLEDQYSSFDCIFFRIDRVKGEPNAIFDFFSFIEKSAPDVQFVNSPQGLIETKSKEFLVKVRDVCPKFEVINSVSEAFDVFANTPFVLKPLDGYGGHGIIRVLDKNNVSADGQEHMDGSAVKFLGELPSGYFPVMAMEYLENVSLGDKRSVVTAGKCLGSVVRIPKKNSWLANLAQGATSEPAAPDQDELAIIERIDPLLRENNILVYGIDTLVDNSGKRILSEINTANVGGFSQIQSTSGKPVLKEMADLIYEVI